MALLSTSLVVTHAQDGGFASASAATDAANADVRARALEVERLVLAAAAAEEAAQKKASGVGALGHFDPEISEEGTLDIGTETDQGDEWMQQGIETHFPEPTPTPMIDINKVVWTNCAVEGELCDCGYQGSGEGETVGST